MTTFHDLVPSAPADRFDGIERPYVRTTCFACAAP